MPQRSGGARGEWYDRNLLATSNYYAAGNIAPHVFTRRTQYIVPAGRRAIVQNTVLEMDINTVATTPSYREMLVYIVQSTGSIIVSFAYMTSNSNTVGLIDRIATATHVFLLAGDRVEIWTSDLSTGGSMNYNGSVVITEFDA